MKKHISILAALASIKFIIQCIGNRNYGFHRDELLHLSVSEHMSWGYYEFPPFIAAIGKLSYWLFDYALVGVRLFPTIAGVIILIICCQMAKELGGKSAAIFLAGICILAFIPFYRNHTLFQPVAFDQLFWTLGFYYFIRFINTEHKKYLMLVGITLGMGLMNKYTMLVWAFGMALGIIFYQEGRLFKDKWLYLSGLISLLIFSPNVVWQASNDLPILKHLSALNNSHLNHDSPWVFLLDQLAITPTFIMFICGFLGLFFNSKLKPFKSVGIGGLIIFFTMWLVGAKTYYVFALYPLLFAAGAVTIEHLFSKKPVWAYIIAASILLPMIYFIPVGTPVLSISSYVKYKGHEEVNGRVELTGDYADMFGWEEQVSLVDSIYQSFSENEKQNCVIWAENYGEAGAIKILGKKYLLPNPVSRHGSFWAWGPGKENATVWISIGNEKPAVEEIFGEIMLVKRIYHKYAIDEENGIPVYICRKPKTNIPTWWHSYKEFIFE